MIFCLPAFIPHVSSAQRRVFIKGDSGESNLSDGATITIIPALTYDIFCFGSENKHWYRAGEQSAITRLRQETNSPDVYVINTLDNTLTLRFRPFQSTHAGEYECGFTGRGYTLAPLSVFLSKLKLYLVQNLYVVRLSNPILSEWSF